MSEGNTPDQPTYCPACGTALGNQHLEGRMRRYCPSCEKPIYRNPKPCAGVLVVGRQERVLLVKRTEVPAVGAWSVPAGYLEADEPPRQAAVRELCEETGLDVSGDDFQLFATTFVRHPTGTHVLVVIYTTPRSAITGDLTPGSDAAEARFWELSELQSSKEQIEPGYESVFERAIDETSRR